MSEKGAERRLDPRAPANGAVQAEYVMPAPRVRDISISGLYLEDSRTFVRGQTIDLRLRLGDEQPIEVTGMVRRVDPGRGVAIEFTHIDAHSRRRLKEYVSAHSPRNVAATLEDF
jgi:hypothetical protein